MAVKHLCVRRPVAHCRHTASVRRLRCESFGPSNLDLKELDVGLFSADPERLLVPAGQRGRVFGGQVVGQALHAAALTAPAAMTVHSLHAYFLKAGRTDRPILYHVENMSDGRSFASRRVLARQAGQTIFHCQASFQVPEESTLEHSVPMRISPGPDECRSVEELVEEARANPKLQGNSPAALEAQAAVEAIADFVAKNPVEVRYAEGTHFDVLDPDPPALPPKSVVWMKTRLPLGDDPNLHYCAAAFFSDWCLLATALLPHRIVFPGVSAMAKLGIMASLDHSMWFHTQLRADEWLCYDVESPRATGNRALAFGRLYSYRGPESGGTLCATVAQEGLVRKRREGDVRREMPM